MAWNEPGGGNNKPKDPWGGGDQGPPDLDEALKKLQEKLGGKIGMDATNKLPGETSRDWGMPIRMDAEVKSRVDAMWQSLGL